MSEKKRKKMRGTVQRVIKPAVPGEPEKAQIGIAERDELYREIRVENVVTDENGAKARLKAGADVDLVIEAVSDFLPFLPFVPSSSSSSHQACLDSALSDREAEERLSGFPTEVGIANPTGMEITCWYSGDASKSSTLCDRPIRELARPCRRSERDPIW